MARPHVLHCGRFRFAARRRVGFGDKASTSAKGPGVAAPPTLEPPCDRNSLDPNHGCGSEAKKKGTPGVPSAISATAIVTGVKYRPSWTSLVPHLRRWSPAYLRPS